MKKLLLAAMFCATTAQAGYFSHASEAYLINVHRINQSLFQCTYKSNPGGSGWINFHVNFQNGCPRFVHYNARNGQVTVP